PSGDGRGRGQGAGTGRAERPRAHALRRLGAQGHRRRFLILPSFPAKRERGTARQSTPSGGGLRSKGGAGSPCYPVGARGGEGKPQAWSSPLALSTIGSSLRSADGPPFPKLGKEATPPAPFPRRRGGPRPAGRWPR